MVGGFGEQGEDGGEEDDAVLEECAKREPCQVISLHVVQGGTQGFPPMSG